MTLQPALLSGDDEERAEAYEALVLDSLGVREEALNMRRLAQTYARISDALAAQSAVRPTNSQQTTRNVTQDDISNAIVWAVIYGARTFQIAHRLLIAYPPKRGSFCELGAGLGPFALRAALSPEVSDVSLVDIYQPPLESIAKMYSKLQLRTPRATRADMRSYKPSPTENLAVPFAFREVGSNPSIIEHWLDTMSAGSRIYVVEPGTKPIARELQRARDALRQKVSIVGPCQHDKDCPRLIGSNDWCHFTWRVPLGPIGRKIAAIGQRKWHELHASWLILEKPEPEKPGAKQNRENEGVDRSRAVVLSIRPGSKECEARLCCDGGEIRLLAGRRNREAYSAISNLEPGDVVELDSRGTRIHGGGTVLEEPEAIRSVAPIRPIQRLRTQ
ncbi:MAG: hypothetical protein IPK13_05760 [Deltaproteobacteria bacterium]|nr:hypothetical protein [Deltaproteobacteria bacterium]